MTAQLEVRFADLRETRLLIWRLTLIVEQMSSAAGSAKDHLEALELALKAYLEGVE